MSDAPEWTIGRLLQWTADYFQKQGIDSPRLDAEVLLAKARGCERIDLYTAFHEPAGAPLREAFRDLVRRRVSGTPVAYLVGHREFYSMSFAVSPTVLIPRPETESLVVAALDRAKTIRAGSCEPHPLEIADVGTGSGAIAIALARHAQPCRVTAIDICPAALQVARNNAERLGVTEWTEWVESDLFSSVPGGRRYHLIVSNPPYVTEAEFETLPKDIRDHEPKMALVSGPRGTEVIERLVATSTDWIRPGGWLLCEIGPAIATAARECFQSVPGWEFVASHRDLAGHERVIEARRIDAEGD
ncbi:MAG: peptide chain release factor N(5)-glutamine methyltransferase [Pirellulales bacterium]|nr:peptide chain release factor N(5)-glutamine methyltransferase [Pirellulales bacterium]